LILAKIGQKRVFLGQSSLKHINLNEEFPIFAFRTTGAKDLVV
jgi:hypothetical protein